MQIFTIIPVYNRKNITLQFLNDLNNQTYTNFKIIVFDDGSTDGTSEAIQKEFPNIRILRGDGNYWWTKSINASLRFAINHSADYVLLLNDDIRLANNLIETFVNNAKIKPNAIFGAANYDLSTNTLLFAGEKRNWCIAGIKKNSVYYQSSVLSKKKIIETEYLAGRGLWIPVQIFNRLGLFDEKNFPQSAADYDFTIRAKRAAIEIYCLIDAKVYSDINNLGASKFPADKLINIFPYLTSRKSAGRIITRWKFAIKNCPKLLLPCYLIIDTLRIIFGFLVKYIFHFLK